MKSPNPSNIDQWLFHYFEGDLSSNEEALLEDFLLEHPQYDTQFEAWGAARIVSPQLEFISKGTLLKPLVAPALLHRVAVISALGVNAILAAFIIFNSKPVHQDFASAAFQGAMPRLAQSTNILDFESQIGSSKANSSQFSQTSSASENGPHNTLNVSLINGVASEFHVVSSSDSSISFRDDYTFAISDVQDDVRDIGFDAFEQNEVASTSLAYVSNEHETNLFEIESLPRNTEVQSVSSAKLDEQAQVVNASNSAHSNTGTSREKSDSDSRERRSSLFSNRFKNGGELMLTNSRDVEYLVPGMNRNQINFGHVASDFSNSVYSNTYMQWPNQSSAMLSNQLGLDLYLPEAKSGLGLQLMYDRYANGAINNMEFSATYSPKFFLNKKRTFILEPALRLRMGGTGVDRNQLVPGSVIEFDRSNAFVYTNVQHNSQVNRSVGQDFGLGLLLNTKWGFVGANADNLLGTRNFALHYGADQFVDRMPVFFNAVIGTEYESRDRKLKMSGQIVYQNFGELNKLWFGSRVKYNSISLGASVSSAGEPMLSAGWVSRQISILYSTDYALSQMSGKKHLSHQLTMRVTLKESRLRKLMLN